MNTEWVQELSGRTGIVATDLDLGDAVPPLAEFWMDVSPREVRADRLGVAAALLYGNYVGGRFSPPAAISSGVAQAIAHHWNGQILPMRVRSGADAIPEQGGVQLVIEPDLGSGLDLGNTALALRRYAIRVLASDKFSGRLVAMDRLEVASNAWLHSSGSGIQTVNAKLAVTVLLASDLQASSILCELPEGSGREELRSLERLLSAVGLGLGWYTHHEREVKVHG